MNASPHTTCLATGMVNGRRVEAILGTETSDPAWDKFLRGDSGGQFQQSGAWAEYKRSENWRCLRVTFQEEAGILGGFQMLWRATRRGKVGYISKGPVLPAGDGALTAWALEVVREVIHRHRLAILFLQPPDQSMELIPALQKQGFTPNRLTKIIDATLKVDLSGLPGGWEANLNETRRSRARQAIRRGATIREGDASDLPRFFQLMKITCERQGVPPTPASLETVSELFKAFQPTGESRLGFAICGGEPVAGVLDLRFGRRYTNWKKGWDGTQGRLNPNVLLAYDCVRRAQTMGCDFFDFGGIERPLAEALVARQPLTEAQEKHYDAFKLGFGGEPQLLPPGMVYFRNPLIRFAYRQIANQPALTKYLRSLTRGI